MNILEGGMTMQQFKTEFFKALAHPTANSNIRTVKPTGIKG